MTNEAGCVVTGVRPVQRVCRSVATVRACTLNTNAQDLGRQIVYPMHLNSQTSMDECARIDSLDLRRLISKIRMHSLFDVLPATAKSILLAISANDSSIVYYKISKGIVPPKEVKD